MKQESIKSTLEHMRIFDLLRPFVEQYSHQTIIAGCRVSIKDQSDFFIKINLEINLSDDEPFSQPRSVFSYSVGEFDAVEAEKIFMACYELANRE